MEGQEREQSVTPVPETAAGEKSPETIVESQVEPEIDVGARIEEIFRGFEAQGAPGATASVTCRIDLEGVGGGSHLLRIEPSGVQWSADSGDVAKADIGVRLTVEDFLAIADGNFDGRLAVASERIELSGDLTLAENLLGWLEPPED